MDRLRERYLIVALDDVSIYLPSQETIKATEAQKAVVNKAAPVSSTQILNQEIFEYEYSQNLAYIPIVGQIFQSESTSFPSADFNYYDADSTVDVATSLLPQTKNINQFFAFEIVGDPMNDALILDGEIIILKPISSLNEVQNGEMVTTWLPNRQENLIKHLYKEKYGYRLQPANPTIAPTIIKDEEPLEVNGIVIMVIRKIEDSNT